MNVRSLRTGTVPALSDRSRPAWRWALPFFAMLLLGLAASAACPERTLTLSSLTEVSGRQAALSVSMVGTGNENGLSFSVSFDPAKLTYLGQVSGAGAGGTSLIVNTNQAASGALGFLMAKPAGQSFASGSNELVRIIFLLSGTAANTPVSFSDTPLTRDVVDTQASSLCANYTNGQVVITPLFSASILTDPVSRTVQPILNIPTNTTFLVTAGGSPPLSYQWRWNGTNISGASGASLTLSNLSTANAGGYDVIVSNEGGAVTSKVATLTVLPALIPPSILANPRGQVVSTGETVYLLVNASGSSPLSYQWQRNNSNLSLETNSLLTLTNITAAQAGNYTVIVTNAAGKSTSQAAVLTVSTNLRVVRVIGTSVATAGTTDLPVELVGFGDESAVGFSLNFNPAALSFVSARLGSAAPGSGLVLNTNSLQSGRLGIAITRQAGQTFPAGTNQLVLVRFTAGSISGPAPVSFGSQPVAMDVADVLANSRPASFRDGVVNVLATAASITQDPQSLTVPIFSTATFTPGIAGSAPLTFKWQRDGNDLPNETGSSLTLTNVTPSLAGAYRLIASNAAGSATSAVATLSVRRVVRAVATNGPTGNMIELPIQLLGAGNENALGFSLDFDPARMAPVSVTPGSGMAAAALNFNTNQPGHVGVAVSRAINQAFGFGTQEVARVQFLLGQQPGNIAPSWSDQPIVRELTDGSANTLDTLFVPGEIAIQLLAPIVTRQPEPKTAWAGQDVTFDLAVTGSRPMRFQWQKNGNNIAGATNESLTIANVQAADGANYSVNITNAAGGASSASALLTVLSARPDLFVSDVVAPTTGVAGQPISATWKLFNNGNAEVPAGWWHTFWLASDSAGSSPQFVAAIQFTNSLAAGQSLSVTGLVTLPPSLLGQRFFMVRADGSNDVAELREDNNAAVSPQSTFVSSGDLALSGLSSPPSAQVGQTISVSWVVTNGAFTDVKGPWQDRIYLANASNSLAGAITLLTSASTGSTLAAGAAYTNTQDVILPGNGQVAPGTYYIAALADCFNATFELTKTNNLRAVPIILMSDYVVAASNNPPQAGSVSGTGHFLRDATAVLKATANFGYLFSNWTENGIVVGSSPSLTNTVTSDRFFVANYAEANVLHSVTTGTSPAEVGIVSGAGTYTNGQTGTFLAPVSVTNPPNIYNFKQFLANGSAAGSLPTFTKTFSTLDPTNLVYTAVYDSVSILPLVTNVTRSFANTVPATTNFVLSFRFNRAMNPGVMPLVVLTNPAAALQASVLPGGTWATNAVPNDTFSTLPITFSPGMDGTNFVWISQARDTAGSQLVRTNPLSFVVDATAPANPILSLTSSNSTSATVSWNSYVVPADLSGFRMYLSTESFTSVSALTAVSSLGASARSFTFTGLTLDRPYYAAIAAVDQAGNSSGQVIPLAFTLSSTVPPPVALQVSAPSASSATISWNTYNTSALLGFSGFQLYYESTNFTSVAGLTPRRLLGPSTRETLVENLDRTRTWYFAVVGINVNNGFNPAVTTATWRDPYAGQISSNTTLSAGGAAAIDVLQSITVVNNAVLTIPAGTTLRFAPGTGITIQQGSLRAEGTPLDPIIFTSAQDQAGLAAAPGDWNGVSLNAGAGASVLRHVFVRYGRGLQVADCAPTVEAFTGMFNSPAGLTLSGSALLATTSALLAVNDIGAQQLGAARLTLGNSVIKNNGTNALASGGVSLQAAQNWWGTTDPAEISASIRGAVDVSPILTGEPLLTPAMGTLNNVTQVGGGVANLRLACRTADTMRLSEDSTFNGVFFSSYSNSTVFPLSAGAGLKTIFAQFRSVTGQTSAPVSVTVNYITDGPSISAFNLTEGMTLSRPLMVTGSASAPLGMATMELYVDGIGQATNSGGSISFWLDIRTFTSDIHRVKLLARDTAGNLAARELNVAVAPTPPPAPSILTPSSDLFVNTNNLLISGVAEPFVQVRLSRSGSMISTTNAGSNGVFTFRNVVLNEGVNLFTVQASDAGGTASSPTRSVTLDTVAPAQLILDTPQYQPGSGLNLSWRFPESGKRASTFKVLWSNVPITRAADAAGSTLLLNTTATTVRGLATTNYFFYVVGYDSTGNESSLSVAVPFNYDAVPPAFAIAFNKSSPVGVGLLHIVLNSSEALRAVPGLTIQPSGSAVSFVTLSNSAVNTYEADINVTTMLSSGPVQFRVSATDLAGNAFNGAPAGPAMAIDVTPPAGFVRVGVPAPIQTTNTVTIPIILQLNELPQTATVPTLAFGPPTGSSVPIALTGSGTNWSGSLALDSSMGSGMGHFTLTVLDEIGNIGHSILSGSSLELYNTAVPSAPAQPVNFHTVALADGKVRLTWNPVETAEIYRVYSEAGSTFVVPTTLVADNITANEYEDLPAADGSYRYVVSASRRGAEGPVSIVRVVVSDRTPPPAPTNVVVQLAAVGLQISWEAGAGEVPHHYNLYRNGSLIRTVSSVQPVTDNPPRGIMSYRVASVDALGNEALSDPVTYELLVGAIGNLRAVVTPGQAPALTWNSADATAVGFNVYRNGIKQNGSLLTNPAYLDSLPPDAGGVTYAITAVNATNAESAARSVSVYNVDLNLLVNAGSAATSSPPVLSYFDDYQVSITNLTTGGAFPLQQFEIRRSSLGSLALDQIIVLNTNIAAAAGVVSRMAIACSSNTLAQTVRVRAVQQTDSSGSSVVYEESFPLLPVQAPGVMVDLNANQLPLAGGLTPFNVRVYNRGYTPVYLATSRANGSQPGDVYISVKNAEGQEVSRTPFQGSPPGILFSDGTGYLVIAPGSSTSFVVPDVFVPLALASNTVTFQVVASAIYDRATGVGQQRSGPLSGSMQSDLAETPYYGMAQTDRILYANDQPVVISGQAIERLSGQPVPNVALKIGFSTRGHRWFTSVTTDASGNYTYSYTPPPGLAGTLTIWAAHPDVFDMLNQAQIAVFRVYASPSGGSIRMSKNSTLPFTISLINPGELSLSGFTSSFEAYQMQGTNKVPVSKIRGTLVNASSFYLGAGEQRALTLELAADADAPDNALGVFTLTSAEGAQITFTATLTILPAVPILTVVEPDIGYVEAALNRGTLLSRQVTIANRGLQDLRGVTVQPPTNVTWMSLNLPQNSDGSISLPDIGVGQSNTFSVVFTPPTNSALGFFQDTLTIRGTNSTAAFDVHLFARVTSANRGAVQFYVDNILGLDVPNATVRLRNTSLQAEPPPVFTDINGLVTVTNLQEGEWSWQISAPGHSTTVGLVTVVPDQTVDVSTRLTKSLVTVNFTVTPVPFTDRYEITLEQTFETHVPAPVLVMTPVFQHFADVTPGYQATLMVTVKNEGLIQMSELTIEGSQNESASFVPLITYVPVLLPQQSIEVPFTFSYLGTNAPAPQGGAGGAIASCSGMPGTDGIGDFINGLNAFSKAYAQCAKDAKWIAACATVAITYQVVMGATKGAKAIAGALNGGIALAKYLGCILGKIIGPIPIPAIPLVGLFDPITTEPSSQQFEPMQAGCFLPDTKILLADGSTTEIRMIKPGDIIRSGPGAKDLATVVANYKQSSDTCRELRVATHGSAETSVVGTTDEHLFWENTKGWTMAAELKVGQWLINNDRERMQITSSERIAGTREVYTLKLQGDSAFYANGILVHDLCGAAPPQESATPEQARTAALATPVNLSK